MRRAGDAGERHIVQEALGRLAQLRHTRGCGGGRSEADQLQSGRAQGRQHGRLLQRAIHQQHAVDAGRHRLAGEARIAVDLERIEVTHQHDRRARITLAECSDPAQHVGQADAAGDRPLAGVLDHRAIGHRVGKRHSQLDQVGTRRNQRMHQRHRVLRRRIARGDERNQTGAAGRLERGEARIDAAHTVTPSRSAMVCTSLSPRPDRLHSTSPSLGSSRASFIACATAWLDSSAARMPSERASK